MLNAQWLNTFRTLVEIGHFTKTADTLFMTQPGVSQHVKKLEHACGVPLIQRINKDFELTDAGKHVYHFAVQQQQRERQLREKIGQDDPFSGVIHLACSGALAQRLYPELLDLQCKHPQLIPKLEVAPTHQILKNIASSQIDLGIVTEKPRDPMLDCQHIGYESLCLLLPSKSMSSRHSLESLSELGLIAHPDVMHYLALYFEQCHEPQLVTTDPALIPVSGYINQLSQILLPVARGLGFTVLPSSAIENAPQKKEITLYQPHNPVREPLYLVSKKHRQLPARFDTLISVIKTLLS